MKGIAKSWVAACVCTLLLACNDSHQRPNAGTSGSNWLKCAQLADCASADEAVACSAEGFCLDADGERIAADQDSREAGTAGSAAVIGIARDEALLQERCLWGTDALLAESGAEAEERINCGRYQSGDSFGLSAGIECFGRALAMQRAVEMTGVKPTLEGCVGCSLALTYLATARGEGFVITHEADARDSRELRELSVSACEEIVVVLEPEPGLVPVPGEEFPFVGCGPAVERYRCQQPLDAPSLDEPAPALPVTPLKLADLSAPGNIARETLHLYVSNQSVDTPLVNIEVTIDNMRVVTGDFDVAGQHNWFEFTILVPAGSHTLRASSRSNEAELEQAIDVPAERWAVVDYWNEGEPESEKFVFTVHDQPVTFD